MSTTTEPTTTEPVSTEQAYPEYADVERGLLSQTSDQRKLNKARKVYWERRVRAGENHYKAGNTALTSVLADKPEKLKLAKREAGLDLRGRATHFRHRDTTEHDDAGFFERHFGHSNKTDETEVTERRESGGNRWLIVIAAFVGGLVGLLLWSITSDPWVVDKFRNGEWSGDFFGTVANITYFIGLVGLGVAVGGYLVARRHPVDTTATSTTSTKTTSSSH